MKSTGQSGIPSTMVSVVACGWHPVADPTVGCMKADWLTSADSNVKFIARPNLLASILDKDLSTQIE